MKQFGGPLSEQETQAICDGGQPEDVGDELHQREEQPTGLLYFTRYDSVPIMTKALFGSNTSREFTYTELANKAGLSPKTVGNRIEILFDLGIIEPVDDTNRFRLNLDGEITWKLRELDGLIKTAMSGVGVPERKSSSGSEAESADPTSSKTISDQQGMVQLQPDESTELLREVQRQVTSPEKHAD